MLFAAADNEWIVWAVLGGILLWMLFMMTFRTRDFIDLMKADEERKRRIAERQDRHLGMGLKFLSWMLRK